MFWKRPKDLESKEYEKCLIRIGELNAELSILKSRLVSQDLKLDDLKVLLGKLRRETNKIRDEEAEEQTESVNNDDAFAFFK